jgi:hypothetical protein
VTRVRSYCTVKSQSSTPATHSTIANATNLRQVQLSAFDTAALVVVVTTAAPGRAGPGRARSSIAVTKLTGKRQRFGQCIAYITRVLFEAAAAPGPHVRV